MSPLFVSHDGDPGQRLRAICHRRGLASREHFRATSLGASPCSVATGQKLGGPRRLARVIARAKLNAAPRRLTPASWRCCSTCPSAARMSARGCEARERGEGATLSARAQLAKAARRTPPSPLPPPQTHRERVALQEAARAHVEAPPLLVAEPRIRLADAALEARGDHALRHLALRLQLDGRERLRDGGASGVRTRAAAARAGEKGEGSVRRDTRRRQRASPGRAPRRTASASACPTFAGCPSRRAPCQHARRSGRACWSRRLADSCLASRTTMDDAAAAAGGSAAPRATVAVHIKCELAAAAARRPRARGSRARCAPTPPASRSPHTAPACSRPLRRRVAVGHGRGRRVRHLPQRVRGVLPGLHAAGRRLPAAVGHVQPRVPPALHRQVARGAGGQGGARVPAVPAPVGGEMTGRSAGDGAPHPLVTKCPTHSIERFKRMRRAVQLGLGSRALPS